jgi:hypothetical protein
MARTWNIFMAILFACNGLRFTHDWYVGNPAEWFVWFNAIFACVIMFLWCVSDAIRGEW